MTDITLLENKHNELYQSFLEIFQGRSDFQLKNFVVNTHVSSERQYAQCVIELQNKYYTIKKADISTRKLKHKLKSETCPFKIEEIELELEQINIAIIGALREFDTLYKIYEKFPKYKNKDLQEAESKYWIERLTTQAQQDIEATGTISVGNAEALRQMGIIKSYSERFFESLQNHPGLVKEKQDEMLSLQSESE